MKLVIFLLLIAALTGCYRMDRVCVTEYENKIEPVTASTSSGVSVTTFAQAGRSVHRCHLERSNDPR